MGDGALAVTTDTGIDREHAQLKDNIAWAVSFVPTGDETDKFGHGTHVAGIMASVKDSIEPVGCMPRLRVASVKVLDDNGSGSLSWIVKGFDHVIMRAQSGEEIDAINASWGGYVPRDEVLPLFRDIFNKLKELGIVVVTSAGNSAQVVDENLFLCSFGELYENIICVGAFSANGVRSCFSNCSSRFVHISAPGEDILSTVPGGRLESWSGTSMAAPFVTAVAAALVHLTRSVEITRWALERGAVPWTAFPRRPRGDETRFDPGQQFILQRESKCDDKTEWSRWGVLDAGTSVALAKSRINVIHR
jgi:subtilisin family serine protease